MGGVRPTEPELLEASAAGDVDAFRALVSRHQSLVLSVAFSATGDAALSEDIAQETFLAAWRGLGSLREPDKFRAWLCGTTRNLSSKALRQVGREIPRDKEALDAVAELESERPVLDDLLEREAERLVWTALASLPQSCREVLILYYQEEKSTSQVSALLGLSENAVHKRLSRGRRFLKARVARRVAPVLARARPSAGFASATVLAIGALGARGAAAATSSLATTGSSLFSVLSGVTMIKTLFTAGAAAIVLFLAYASLTKDEATPTDAVHEGGGSGTARAGAEGAKPAETTQAAAGEPGGSRAVAARVREKRLRDLIAAFLRKRGGGRLTPARGATRQGSAPSEHELLVRFVGARKSWQEGDLEEAIPVLAGIIEDAPEQKVAEYATNLLLDSVIKLGEEDRDYDLDGKVYKWADELLGNSALIEGRDELRSHLEYVRLIALRHFAEEWASAGNYEGCALAYQSILDQAWPTADAEQFPAMAGELDDLLWGLATCAAKAGWQEEARAALERLLRETPDSPFSARAREQLSKLDG